MFAGAASEDSDLPSHAATDGVPAPVVQQGLTLWGSWQAEWQANGPVVPDSLYHYTDVSGFHRILESRELWASNAAYLNDRTELLHTLLLLKELLAGDPGDESPQGKGTAAMRHVLENFYQYMDVYVACFCETRDLLSQWRAYGSGAGYAIEFSGPTLASWCFGRVAIQPAVYDATEQRRLLRDLLDRWRDLFSHQSDWGPEPETSRIIQLMFAETLSHLAISFKNTSFSEEREWRFAYRRSAIVPDDGLNFELRFRTRNGMLLPYVGIPVLSGEEAQKALKGVLVGPTLYPEQAGYAAMRLLGHLGHVEVPVSSSDIPLRF